MKKLIFLLLLALPFFGFSQAAYLMEFTNPNGSKVVFNLNDVRSCVAEGTGSYLFTRTGSGKTQVQESPATIATNSCGNIVLFTVFYPASQFNDTRQMGVNPNYVVGVVSNTSGNGVLKMITPTENWTTTSTYNAAVALLSICVSGGGGGGGSLTNTYVGFGDGLNQLDGEAGFTYDAESNRLAVDTVKTKRITAKVSPLEILGDLKGLNYSSSRNDAGRPTSMTSYDVNGGFQRHGIYELKDSLGLAIPSTLIPYGTGTGLSSDANFNYTTATRKLQIGNIWLWNGLSLASSNVGLGLNSLNSTTSGTSDVMVGTSCGVAITGATQCTGVGGNAMVALQTGFNNTAVGFGSMPSLANASNVTCLGANSAATKSNQVVIGDALIAEVLFKTGSKFAHVTSTTLDASTNGYVWMYDNATSNIKLQPIATGIKKREQNFVATAAQTVFTLSSYTPTAPTGDEYPIEVFRNGVRLSWVASAPTVKQYTYTGAAVTMTACALNDDVVITYIK